jgi:hypothetical protein
MLIRPFKTPVGRLHVFIVHKTMLNTMLWAKIFIDNIYKVQ